MMNQNEKLFLPVFSEMKGVRGFFSTKAGASEGSPYNRREVLQAQGLERMQLISPKQVHGDHIEVIDPERPELLQNRESGNFAEPIRFPDTDGVITDATGILLTTVHADCLAVYFYDEAHHAIGLVHAGWRGSCLGISQKAVRMMQECYGSEPSQIRAFIGPGISKCCFEVGEEVVAAFCENWSFAGEYAEPRQMKSANSDASKQEDGNDGQPEAVRKYLMDLKGINHRQLTEIGLKPEHIQVSSHCTYCEGELFCSYRREGGTYKRMGAGLWLTED